MLSRYDHVVGAVGKKRIQILILKEQSVRNTDYKLMENHLYQCIYDKLRSDTPEAAKLPALQLYKAKIVRFHARRIERVILLVDNNTHEKMDGVEPTLFHILKMINRRETRTIRHVQDKQDNTITRPQDILNTFVTHLRQKNGPTARDNTCVAKLQSVINPPVHQNTPTSSNNQSPPEKSSPLCEKERGTKRLASTASACSFSPPTGRRYTQTYLSS